MASKTEDAEAKTDEKEEKSGGGKMKMILMLLPTVLLGVAHLGGIQQTGVDQIPDRDQPASRRIPLPTARVRERPGVQTPLDRVLPGTRQVADLTCGQLHPRVEQTIGQVHLRFGNKMSSHDGHLHFH